jgi:hypothetical protein
MLNTKCRFETSKASQYLQQLCKHFAHKVEARFDDREGTVDFARGTAVLIAEDDVLVITVTAEDQDGLEQTKGIIESHLLRFAFRENVERLNWD